MFSRTVLIYFLSFAVVAGIFSGCKNVEDIPFPDHDGEFQRPPVYQLHLSAPEEFKWPQKTSKLSPTTSPFDFAHLPASKYDTSDFLPFAAPPQQVNFSMNNLPDSIFNYDRLPSIPLHFITSIIPPPDIIQAQPPEFKAAHDEHVFEFAEPIAGTVISALCKTRGGLIWIMAGNRLYSYDGQHFFGYKINSIKSIVTRIIEDRKNRLWMSTSADGIIMVDIAHGISRQLSMRQGLASNLISRLIVDSLDRIWAGVVPPNFNLAMDNGGGVVIIDEEKQVLKTFDHRNGLSANIGGGVMLDNDGNLWLSTLKKGITILDLKNNRIKWLTKANGLTTDTVAELSKDASGNIWACGFLNGIDIINPAGTITHLGPAQNLFSAFIASMQQDQEGNSWVSGTNNVTVFDQSLTRSKQLSLGNGLDGYYNNALLSDAKGQLYIGSNNGMNLIRKNNYRIRHFGNSEVSTMLEDSHGRIWMGGLKDGVHIYDTGTGKVSHYGQLQGLNSNLIQNIVEFKGRMIIGTQNDGIEIIDTSLATKQFIGPRQGLAAVNIAAILPNREGQIWIGSATNAGLDLIDPDSLTVKHFGIAEGIRDTAFTEIKEDLDGRIWTYSTSHGLSVIDPVKKTVQHSLSSIINPTKGLAENHMLMPDSRGNIWLGSSLNGIILIHRGMDSATWIRTENGLLSNSISSLKEAGGKIYVGSNKGLTILTPPVTGDSNWQVESIGRAYGVSRTAATYNSDALTTKGDYWWGDNGITVISNTFKNNAENFMPAAYVSGITIVNQLRKFFNDSWDAVNKNDSIRDADKDTSYKNNGLIRLNTNTGMNWDSVAGPYNMPVGLTIPYNKNFLQFHFLQVNPGNSDSVWYRYVLEGIDRAWSARTRNNFSENYLNLTPGSYRFKVSSLYHGQWAQPAEFSFDILPPWWKTWWAWLMYILLFSTAVWSFIQYRSGWLKKENQRLEDMVRQRTGELSASLEELKTTQTQLVQSEKMASLGELTAGIAHEIQNPLNFVNNFSEVNRELIEELRVEQAKAINERDPELEKGILDDIDQNLEKINHHGKRADSIVKGMLQHSRSSNGQKELTDINALVDEYLRLTYHGLRAKDKAFNATMITDFDKSIPKINIIPQDVGRAILNLFTNAFYSVAQKKINFPTEYEPTVSVSTKKLPGKVEIRVKDNGSGIPPKALDKIFQPFFTTKPSGQGTGLGLSLTFDIITKGHGGQMTVDTKEGEFAEFIIQLPL